MPNVPFLLSTNLCLKPAAYCIGFMPVNEHPLSVAYIIRGIKQYSLSRENLAAEERVILFKNPSGGPQYAQALLNVFCAPTNTTVKLTTYSSLWIPQAVFDNPRTLDNRRAIFVCADAERDSSGAWWLKKFYPVREVIIKSPKIEGKFLTLYVQVLGFVRCNNYDEYTREIKQALSTQGLPLPPMEHSYISFDQIRGFDIVSGDDENGAQAQWQSIAETLAKLKVFDKSAFYNVSSIDEASSKDEVTKHRRLRNVQKMITMHKDAEKIPLKVASEGERFAYQLNENKKYEITVTHLLPFHNQDSKIGRLDLEIVMPKLIERDNDEAIDISGRQGSQIIPITAMSVPHAKYVSVKIQPKDITFSNAPVVMLPFSINPIPLWKRYWKRATLIFPIVILGIFYAYAQLMQGTKSFPSFDSLFTGSAEAWGATFSAILLILIPILVSQMLKRKNED